MSDLKSPPAAAVKKFIAAAGAPSSPAGFRPTLARLWPTHRRPSRKLLELIVLLTPALALFTFFVLLPICIAAYYGLFNWSGYGPLSDFVGLHNYRLVLDDPVFRESVLHNVIIAVLSLV